MESQGFIWVTMGLNRGGRSGEIYADAYMEGERELRLKKGVEEKKGADVTH